VRRNALFIGAAALAVMNVALLALVIAMVATPSAAASTTLASGRDVPTMATPAGGPR
jgi:hypothetical protein